MCNVRLILAVATIIGIVVSGCTSDGDLDLRALDQSWSKEWDKRWLCDGLTLYKKGHKGKIDFEATGDEISTFYRLDGLNPRWSWDDLGTSYAVVLKQAAGDMVAYYYNFSYADEDGMTKPRSTFWDCI